MNRLVEAELLSAAQRFERLHIKRSARRKERIDAAMVLTGQRPLPPGITLEEEDNDEADLGNSGSFDFTGSGGGGGGHRSAGRSSGSSLFPSLSPLGNQRLQENADTPSGKRFSAPSVLTVGVGDGSSALEEYSATEISALAKAAEEALDAAEVRVAAARSLEVSPRLATPHPLLCYSISIGLPDDPRGPTFHFMTTTKKSFYVRYISLKLLKPQNDNIVAPPPP